MEKILLLGIGIEDTVLVESAKAYNISSPCRLRVSREIEGSPILEKIKGLGFDKIFIFLSEGNPSNFCELHELFSRKFPGVEISIRLAKTVQAQPVTG